VLVGPREALATQTIRVRDVNWLGDVPLEALPPEGMEIAARVRSTRAPQPAMLRVRDGEVEVELTCGEYGVSPGQACVFYASADPRARVLGGGSIRGGELPVASLAPRSAVAVKAAAQG
jgi:tRNA-specific 2-thiouridylase